MTTRLTGIASGLDTQSIIEQMMEGHKLKVDNAKNDQKKLQWKKEAWSSLNTKLYSFYTGALDKFKSVGTYKAKKVQTSNDKAVTVNVSNNAVVGTHTLSVRQAASSAYLTSKSLKGEAYKTTSYVADADAASKQLSEIVDAKGDAIDVEGKSFDITYKDANGVEQTAHITTHSADGTLQGMIDNMNDQLAEQGVSGLKVSYNGARGAFEFTNTTATEKHEDAENPDKVTGYEGGIDFKVKASDDASAKALGISASGVTVSKQTNDTGNNVLTMGNAFNKVQVSETPSAVTGSTKLSDMGIVADTTFTIKVGKAPAEGEEDTRKEYNFTIDKNTTIKDLTAQFSKMGVVANYDEKQGTFFLNSTDSGEEFDFELSASNDNALKTLGLTKDSGAVKIDGQDAIVTYNGATFQQSSNNFSLNGLNFTVNNATVTTDKDGNVISDDPIKMTVSTDTDAIYDAVKDFVKEYNALIKEMNTLYSAESDKDYPMLTDEKKEAMSDDEVKEWESKIKASLLRRDSTISSLLSTMRSSLNKGVNYTGTDGVEKRYSLATFGIVTGEWSELGQLHIEGDKDDSSYSSKTDKLRAAIASDPDALIKTLSTLGSELYNNFQKAMKSSTLSSALTFYNDKQMDTDIKSYDDKIKTLTTKMNNVEDKYYKQFAAMESAMAAMQTQQSSLSGLLGSL